MDKLDDNPVELIDTMVKFYILSHGKYCTHKYIMELEDRIQREGGKLAPFAGDIDRMFEMAYPNGYDKNKFQEYRNRLLFRC